LSELSGAPAVEARGPGWVGAVWRQLRKHSSVGLLGSPDETLPALCSRVALELQLSKLIWLGSCGVLWMPGGRRRSLVDLAGLEQQRREAEDQSDGKDGAAVAELLREIEIMISGGVSSVSACLPGALSDELFTYAGSGTFYSPEGYTEVRRLALDEFAAAENLIQHGVEEGYLLSRYLAGICALLPYPAEGAGELSSLYTLTRFLGEGVGAHLLRHAVECAQAEGLRYVFACTTSQRVEALFLRSGFRSASQDELPASKWEHYSADRLQDVRCLRRDLGGLT
ncbi:MAG: GNAT family N-acetyltransferase, partial [Deltaproteobacteria bacterium]|nr:GNAT family N-acetyltransferase [Deltaproteobacteria bacterium]